LEPTLPPSLPLEELSGLTPEEFDRRFKGTPLHRTGHAALLRNTLLVMGNSGDPRWRPALEKHLSHEDPMVAEQAAWSLSRLPKGDAVI
ncbi:MAG: HEAT repeat domain-containing protein, partial [Elusimicrobiota bacterium]